MRVVLDSNVWIANLLSAGTSRDVVDEILDRCEIVISPYILAEVERVLRQKFHAPKEERERVQQWLTAVCEVVDPPPRPGLTCRDPDDLPILWLALAVHADRLVTGDRDLLELKELQGIKIIPPAQFWQ
ncbi:MAG: putative toxin-antitoxin system toxin component, PIN family [Omnitrophica WOR_2 bacterium RIFCSPHIGHO2_02_FULL_68_15]|nr:MAG: putative toxin-antitoxin system toxin component, PIN family [Omnitrophica WOR_2 bacterium RIFCSPHIGHO2_02_FULL_68_15]